MRAVSPFDNKRHQTTGIPKDMEFQGVSELEICKEGDTQILCSAHPAWTSLKNLPLTDTDFLNERPDVVEEGRLDLSENR